MYTSQRDIERILQEKEVWIQKHIEQMREQEAKEEGDAGREWEMSI